MGFLKTRQNHFTTLRSQSDEILALLENHPAFQAAQTVLLYHSLNDEVNTHSFIQKWSNRKRILLPVVKDNDLELCVYTGPEDLKTGKFGIKEPIGVPFTDYASIDIAIIPGVAFDHKGNRLGRGKGYYDRLLRYIPAYKVGICFPFQLIEEVPAEEFDIRMDIIITNR